MVIAGALAGLVCSGAALAQPVSERPFTIDDLKLPPAMTGGKATRPSTLISIGKGARLRQLSAQEYVDNANLLREAANAKGLTLRGDSARAIRSFLGEARDQLRSAGGGSFQPVPGIPGTVFDQTFGPPFLQVRLMQGSEAIQDNETFGFRNLAVVRLRLFGVDREVFSGVANIGVGYRASDRPLVGASIQFDGVEQLSAEESEPKSLSIAKTVGGDNLTLASYTVKIPVWAVLTVDLRAAVFFKSSFDWSASATAANAAMAIGPKIELGLRGSGKVSVQIADAGIALETDLASVTPRFRTSVTRSIQADKVLGTFNHGADLVASFGKGSVMLEGCFYLLPLLGKDACGDVELFRWNDIAEKRFPIVAEGTDTVTLCVPTCSAKRCGQPDASGCGITCPPCDHPPISCNGMICTDADICCSLANERICTTHATCERLKKASAIPPGGHERLQQDLRRRVAAGRAAAQAPVP